MLVVTNVNAPPDFSNPDEYSSYQGMVSKSLDEHFLHRGRVLPAAISPRILGKYPETKIVILE